MGCVICKQFSLPLLAFHLQNQAAKCTHFVHEQCLVKKFSEECPACAQKIAKVAYNSLGRYTGDVVRVIQDGDYQGIRFIASNLHQFPKERVLASHATALEAALSPPLNTDLIVYLLSEKLLKECPDSAAFDKTLKKAVRMIVHQASSSVTSLDTPLRRIQKRQKVLFMDSSFFDPLFQKACERKLSPLIAFFLKDQRRIKAPSLSPECVEREFLTACSQSNAELINLFLKSYSFPKKFLKKSQETYPFLNPKTHETSPPSPTPAALSPPVTPLSPYASSLSPPVSPLSPPPVMPLPYALSFPPLPPMHPFASLYNLPVLNEDFVAAELNAAVPPPPSFAEATHLPVLSEDLVAAVLDTYGEPRPKAAKPTIDQL